MILGRRLQGDSLVAAAARGERHPLTRLARRVVLAGRDPDVLERLAALALDRPGLAAWCARNDVVPADPGTAAALFLLTGQLRRYRALDPDAALLAEALAAAGVQRRGRLIEAMAGDLDPAAVAARVRGGRMVGDLPVAEAVAAVAGFGSWRPADPALFDRLAAEDPEGIAAAVRALPPVITIDVPGQLVDLTLAPDAGRVAAVYRDQASHRLLDAPLTGGARHAYDLDLTGANLADTLAIGTTRHVAVHLGDAVVAADGRGLALFADGFRRDLIRDRAFPALAALGDGGGWVALAGDGRLVCGARHALVWASAAPVADVRAGARLAGAPDARHIAVATRDLIVLLDVNGRPLLELPWRGGLDGIAFTAGGRLVALERPGGPAGLESRLYRWRIAGNELVEEDVVALPAARNLDALGARLLVLDTGGERLHVRDAATLEPRPHVDAGSARIPYPRAAAGRLALSAHWLRTEHAIEVRPPAVHRLAERPLSALTPGDLGALLEHDERDPRLRPLLDLLRDCLRIRFAADVALGRRDHLADDDIALG
ncbi:hypothetical protein [Dactylosporangium sp. NPDC049140]|uniref:hypothetical protein n=1 Tax=Dactylosporangium sp. NPDC049140 TaxID=3155647 RepID=UPI0034002132